MATSSLARASRRLLTPLVRVLLRYGVTYGEFRDIAKQVYVEVATKHFTLPGRKQTNARVAMLTGIQRKEVARLLSMEDEGLDPLDVEYNRGIRVISGWRRDEDFLSTDGTPLPLSFDSGHPDFTELVKRYSGDLPARTVLMELQRVGAVTRHDDDLIHLTVKSGYIPFDDKDAQFNIMGQSVADLLATLEHNFEAASGTNRLQLSTAYDNLPFYAVERFRHLSRTQSEALLKQFDDWLADHDRDSNPELSRDNSDRYRAGIGIYYFEEPFQDDQS